MLKVDQHFLLTGDCLTFSDPDHLSSCGEELLGEKLKAHLPGRIPKAGGGHIRKAAEATFI